MSDPLEDICGLSDISVADRQRLRSELDFVGHLFARIDRGAGFCEDRGFGWTAQMERAEGSDRLFASMRAWPILRRLLPQLRHHRHEPDPVFGISSVPTDDLVVARLLVDDRWSFAGRYGEGCDERTIVVRLEADSIRVSERTVAGGLGDQPFDESEVTADYAEDRFGPFWARVKDRLAPGEAQQAAVLAQRMRQAVIPCDLCGRTSQTSSIAGSVFTLEVPGSAPQSSEIPQEHLLPLRQAMAAQDMPAIGALNPAWVKGYCAERDASYCAFHLKQR